MSVTLCSMQGQYKLLQVKNKLCHFAQVTLEVEPCPWGIEVADAIRQPVVTSQGEVSQGEVSQGEVSQGEVSQGEVSQGEVSQGEVSQGEVSQGEVSQGEVSQGEVSQEQHADWIDAAVAGARLCAHTLRQKEQIAGCRIVVVSVVGVEVDTSPEDVSCASTLATWLALCPTEALPVFDFVNDRWHIYFL